MWIFPADTHAKGKRIVCASGHAQVRYALLLDVVGGHGEVPHHGVYLTERYATQPFDYVRHGRHLEPAPGAAAQILLGCKPGNNAHTASDEIIKGHVPLESFGCDDDDGHRGVRGGEEGVAFSFFGAYDGGRYGAFSARKGGQMPVPVVGRGLQKGYAQSLLDHGNNVRTHSHKGAGSGRELYWGKFGVEQKLQFFRVPV